MIFHKRALLLLLLNLTVAGLMVAYEKPLASQSHQATEAEKLALFAGQIMVPEGGEQTAVPAPDLEFPSRSLTGLLPVSGTIAFQSDRAGRFDLYQQSADGSKTAEALVTSAYKDVTPAWSPDGTQLLFASDRSGRYDIYLRSANGQEINLTQHTADDVHPSWSPDGQQILFSSDRGGGYFQIYSMNLDGGGVQQVGVVPGNNAMYPRFSPDGQRIAYMRASTTAPLCEWNWDVWVMDNDGSNQEQITTALGADLYPEWSPDGREIIFASCRNLFYFNLYAADIISGAERQVSNWFFYNEWGATYSRDGHFIAFNSAPTGGTADIYIMAASGSGTANNLTQNSADDWNPTWYSPPFDCTAATASPPVMLITGWGGSAPHLRFDDQLRYFETWFGHHGYVLDCNLFYAGDISPHKLLADHSQIIKDNLCQHYDALQQLYLEQGQSWHGEFGIVSYSYGGLRARAFLEGAEYAKPCIEHTDQMIKVKNLFTLGTPHGGEVGNLPFAAWIGLNAILDSEWPALWEMLPPVRLSQNLAQEQNDDTCYHIIAGDGRLQAAFLPTPLLLAYYKWPPAQVLANDFAVHQLSSYSLLLMPHKYPRQRLAATIDLHGQVPAFLDPVGVLRSYVNPKNTFNAHIIDRLQATDCPLLAWSQAADTGHATALLAAQRQPQTTAMPPMQDIAAASINASQSDNGNITVTSAAPTQFMLYWSSGELAFSLTDPQGNLIDPDSAAADPNVEYLALDTGYGLLASYHISETLTGEWSYTINAAELEETAVYRLLTILSLPVSVAGSLPGWTEFNSPVVITATVTHAGTGPVPGSSVTARIQRPDGSVDLIALLDDGQHHDGTAGNGVYGGLYNQTGMGGVYGVLFTATGEYEQAPFVRTGTGFFTVAPDKAHLNQQYADRGVDAQNNGFYDWLEIDVGLSVGQASTYTVAAELYAGSTFVAQASTRLHLAVGEQTAVLRFAGDKIRAGGLDGPYLVRHLLLLDEVPVTLLIETADLVHTSAPYDHRRFGQPLPTYLPLVTR